MIFSIHRKLVLALKKVRIFKITPPQVPFTQLKKSHQWNFWFPPPLTAIGKTLISKTLWSLFVDEMQRLYRATMRRQFTFYENFLVLIKSISERWKFEMTLKPSSGFTKDRLKSQYVKLTQLWALTVNCRPNHYTIEISVLRLEMQFYNIFTNVLYIISLNFKDLWTTYHLWIYQVYMSQLHLASELYWKCTLGGKGLFWY